MPSHFETHYSQSTLKFLLQKLDGGLINFNKEGRITWASDEFLTIINNPTFLDKIRNIRDFIELSRIAPNMANDLSFIFKKGSTSIQFSCIWQDQDKSIPLLFEFYPPEEGHNIANAFVRRIEPKQDPQIHLYKEIIDNLNAVVWVSSIDVSEAYYISPAFERFYEISLEEYYKDPTTLLKRVHPDDIDDLLQIYNPIKGWTKCEFNFRYKLNNGSWRYINVFRCPIFDLKGKLTKFVGINIDNTELCSAKEQLQKHQNELIKANEELKRVNETFEEFTAFACHDLSHPLRVFNFYTDILEKDYLQSIDDKGKSLLFTIKAAIKRMESLIEGIKSLFLIGEAASDPCLINIDSIIEKALKPLYANPLNPLCKLELGQLLPIPIKEEHLTIVLENLIENSIKYCQKSPHVKINSKRFSKFIVYTISDNGIGIPRDAREDVFRIGTRFNTDRGQAGSGIGLSACKRIMALYGGKIWVKNNPSGGSIFYLLFPLKMPYLLEKKTTF